MKITYELIIERYLALLLIDASIEKKHKDAPFRDIPWNESSERRLHVTDCS